MSVSKKLNQKLWEKIKKQVTASDKGGRAGQWSARKAQLATKLYKEAGGQYAGPKTKSNSLQKWTDQDWQYAGKPKKSRYLPKKAIEKLSAKEKKATNRAKVLGTKAGKQHVAQPKKVAKKVAKYRK
ncbi:MAG: hypothetical protein AAF443_01825 [Chlamydiota bacterium]